MQADEYAKMARAEAVMWWYRALHANLLWLIKRYVPEQGPVLDTGCGTGGLIAKIVQHMPDRTIVGLDIFPAAAATAREKSGTAVVAGDVNRLPFKDAAFAAVISADVLYHRQVEPAAAAREAFRCLATDGVYIVNVPAFDWLRSYHDVAIHTARRFNRKAVRSLLSEAGFSLRYCGYWNALLFPIMVIRRKFLPAPELGSDVVGEAGLLDSIFRAITGVERGLMRTGVVFPFGGSCIAVGVKK
jgi:SAM-dependent methyltransferase